MICLRLQFTKTRVLIFQSLKLQLKTEYFVKLRLRVTERMVAVESDTHDSVNWIEHILLNWLSNQHTSVTSIKCFSITIENRN